MKAAAKPAGHKKTVSESETAAGQYPKRIAEMPKATGKKPMGAKTWRPARGARSSRVPRFINKIFG